LLAENDVSPARRSMILGNSRVMILFWCISMCVSSPHDDELKQL
jgi:hypothetical protein